MKWSSRVLVMLRVFFLILVLLQGYSQCVKIYTDICTVKICVTLTEKIIVTQVCKIISVCMLYLNKKMS